MRPFYHIYQSVSLLCPTGSFTLSLSLSLPFLFIFRSFSCSYSSPFSSFDSRVVAILFLYVLFFVRDLFLSLYVLFFVRLYLSIRLFILLYRIFSSLFTSCSSFDVLELFVSLNVSLVLVRVPLIPP